MSEGFKQYRRRCFGIIRDLLEHRGRHVVNTYVARAKETKTESELSRLMSEVRRAI